MLGPHSLSGLDLQDSSGKSLRLDFVEGFGIVHPLFVQRKMSILLGGRRVVVVGHLYNNERREQWEDSQLGSGGKKEARKVKGANRIRGGEREAVEKEGRSRGVDREEADERERERREAGRGG